MALKQGPVAIERLLWWLSDSQSKSGIRKITLVNASIVHVEIISRAKTVVSACGQTRTPHPVGVVIKVCPLGGDHLPIALHQLSYVGTRNGQLQSFQSGLLTDSGRRFQKIDFRRAFDHANHANQVCAILDLGSGERLANFFLCLWVQPLHIDPKPGCAGPLFAQPLHQRLVSIANDGSPQTGQQPLIGWR